MVQRSQAQNYKPTTFLERGASVPFTTPILTGSRVRPADRFGMELVVPNPSGGRGDYILPWTGLRSICRPTVHDVQLTEGVAALRNLTPATIRDAARKVAASGLAGRSAVAAAAAAIATEEEGRIFTKFELLLRIVQQAEPPGGAGIPPEKEHPAALEIRAKRVIATVAPMIRQDNEMIAASLGELATLYNPIGVGGRASRARLPYAIAMLKLLRREVMQLPTDKDEQTAGLVQMVVNTADVTLKCVDHTLAQSRSLLDRLLDLLVAWRANPAGISQQLARTEWLMDGWERICRLWALSDKAADRRNSLEEIAAMLPIIPREAGDWAGVQTEIETPRRVYRMVAGREDWRTGRFVQDLIARNEQLIAA